MRTTAFLSIASLALAVALAPVASASVLGCPDGIVPLVLCIAEEAEEEAWRDVGIVLGLAEPVVNAACDIVFGYHPCIHISTDSGNLLLP